MAALGNWGDEDHDDYLPPRQVTGPDANGVKTVVEYKHNEEGKKVRITTKIQEKKVSKKLSKKSQISWNRLNKNFKISGSASDDNLMDS